MSSRFPRLGSRLPGLTTAEIENILGQWEDSYYDLVSSDDDDITDPSYVLERNGQNLHEDSDDEPKIPGQQHLGAELID
ncbi:unnamed protein product [Euphydryas editha]|uniref:Uncharacterized protein n=1 Tax=Euphydryas editha TaxID=104508 RepID=A0AAU9V0L1_EUPED|nr:unnamed protein product [Euphydryas editha]